MDAYAQGMISRPHLWRMTMAALLLGLVSGCQFFHPHPLTKMAVDRALTPPALRTLEIEARSLNHPILRPIELDERDGLSPEEAAVLAVLLNPTLKAERDRRALAQAQLVQAGILPNPQLNYSLGIPSFGLTQATVDAWDIGGGWDLLPLLTRWLHRKAAAEDRRSVYLDVAWKEWQTAEAAKTAVYKLVSLEAQVRLATEVEQRLTQNLEILRQAVGEQLMTELDLSAAQTAANQGQDRLIKLQKEALDQRHALNKLLGRGADTTVTLQKNIELPSQLAPPAKEDLLDGLEQRRLDLVALRRGYESQEAKVRVAIWEQFPKINLGVSAARDTSNIGTAGPTATADVPLFDRNQGQIAIERATRQKLFDEYVDRVFQARIDIENLLSDIQALNMQITLARQAEPALRKLVETYRVAVNQGQADVLSYYTAWNSLTDKQIEIVSLQEQLAESRIALEQAAGSYRIESIKMEKERLDKAQRTTTAEEAP